MLAQKAPEGNPHSPAPSHRAVHRTPEGHTTKHSRHKAGLNFGDCFSCALAKATGEELLFKGNDFVLTDIEAAG